MTKGFSFDLFFIAILLFFLFIGTIFFFFFLRNRLNFLPFLYTAFTLFLFVFSEFLSHKNLHSIPIRFNLTFSLYGHCYFADTKNSFPNVYNTYQKIFQPLFSLIEKLKSLSLYDTQFRTFFKAITNKIERAFSRGASTG